MIELICITCPNGCHLKVDETNNYAVTGNKCERGVSYAVHEVTNPERVLTSTVVIEGGEHRRLPVKSNNPIPKPKLIEAVRLLDDVKVKSPIKLGDVIVPNILGTGVDIVATRTL